MKISQLGAATLVPATVAGIVLTVMPFVAAAPAAATAARAPHHAVDHATQAGAAKRAPAAKHAVERTAKAATQTSAKAATQKPPTTPTQAPKPAAAQSASQAQTATAGQPLTAGMSSFEQCVAWRESGDNPTASSAGLFGILPATWQQLGYSGTAGQAPVAVQKAAFQRLYAQLGTSPWAPYDGC